jgi:transcription elongation factor GreA
MSYLKDFKDRIHKGDYPAFLKLWEEYCYSDEPDVEELAQILTETKDSELAKDFGQHVTKILPLWEKIKDEADKHNILKLIIDIENTNTEDLAEFVYNYLQEKHPNDPLFNEKIRLIGLRSKEDFQGAISHFELLSHIAKGKFVFHTAGWGTGEILDVSLIREEMTLEFEYVIGQKQLSFANSLKTLIPLKDDHFLARRFGNPDLLEKEAKENPLEIIHLLLRDLGPKTAFEIKENLCDLVIPAGDWNRWWQTVRIKIKKDTKIKSPTDESDFYFLRKEAVSHEDALYKSLETKPSAQDVIQMIHSFFKDFPETLKNKEFSLSLQAKLNDILSFENLTSSQKLQIYFFLEDLSNEKSLPQIKELIQNCSDFNLLLQAIEIASIKKRVLISIRSFRKDWQELFLSFLLAVDQNILRDYIFTELLASKSPTLKDRLDHLISQPRTYPECYLWYFQKVVLDENTTIPFSDKKSQNRLFEGFLILLDHVSRKNEDRDMAKKMINILSENRYSLVRKIFAQANIDEIKEYLLLATKCGLLSDHDVKIIHSLAKVVYPSLEEQKYTQKETSQVIWMTQEGYDKLKKKISKLSSVDTIANAKEIEEARAHGDLRENAEYKAALEKRAQLQGELQLLGDQFNRARVLQKEEVSCEKVNVGTVIDCVSDKGKKQTFTILGPWEANPEKNILSFQSKFAQVMLGKIVGEQFAFQNETFTITNIRNYFD